MHPKSCRPAFTGWFFGTETPTFTDSKHSHVVVIDDTMTSEADVFRDFYTIGGVPNLKMEVSIHLHRVKESKKDQSYSLMILWLYLKTSWAGSENDFWKVFQNCQSFPEHSTFPSFIGIFSFISSSVLFPLDLFMI